MKTQEFLAITVAQIKTITFLSLIINQLFSECSYKQQIIEYLLHNDKNDKTNTFMEKYLIHTSKLSHINSPKQKFKNEKLMKTPSRKSQINTNNINNILIKNNTIFNSLQMSMHNLQNCSKYFNSNITFESCNSFTLNNKES